MSQPQSMIDDTGREPLGFRVREATPQDNAALLALERECVVAAATPVAFDRSPDFFARSRPYSTWRAYVAEGDSGLIGVGAMALKSVLVGARLSPTGGGKGGRRRNPGAHPIAEPDGRLLAGHGRECGFAMPLGFRGAAGEAEAVRLAAALLRRESGPGAARVLAVPHDLADPAYTGLDEFRPIRLGFKMFGLELGGARGPSLGSRPVFVDPADL